MVSDLQRTKNLDVLSKGQWTMLMMMMMTKIIITTKKRSKAQAELVDIHWLMGCYRRGIRW